MLQNRGYHVVSAGSGKGAIEAMEAFPGMDLVLLAVDPGEGKTDDVDAAETILAKRDVPILFLLSSTEDEVIEKTAKIASYGYVVKDGGITMLDASIKTALKLHDGHKRSREQERVLRESEAKVAELSEFRERVFNSTDAHLAVVDKGGKILEVNEAWRRFGLDNGAGDEGVWGPGADYFRACRTDGEDGDSARQAMHGILDVQTGRLPDFEMEYPCKSGAMEHWFRMRVTPLKGDHGGALISHTDITHRVTMERTVRESEALTKALFDLPRDNVVLLTDRDGILLDFNRSLSVRLGRDRHELIGRCVYDFLPPDTAESRRRVAAEVMRTRKPQRLVDTNEPYSYEHVAYPISGDHGRIDRIAVFSYDITALKKAEEALRESEEKYRTIFERAVEGFFQTAPEGHYISVNPALAEMYGYESPEEIINGVTNLEEQQYVVPEDRARLKELYENQGFVEGFEAQLYRKDGSVIWVSITGRAVADQSGAVLCYEGTALDITARKLADEQMKGSLREKEALLKEIHHRVKNNLQIMSSLLRLQSQYVRDREALDILKDSIDRVQTMALTHERLYRSGNLSDIYLPGYITDLTRGLFGLYGMEKGVYLNLDVDPVSFDIDTALPLGLIVNELVSNALKHAFSGIVGGTVRIGLYTENGHATLVVADTGIGFPHGLDFRNTSSMGMQLVVTLVEQLEGTIELKQDKGTEFTITFEMGQ